MIRCLALLVALGLVACHGKSGATTSAAPTPRPVDYAEYELLDRFEALSRYLDRSQGDCGRLAAGLDAWIASNTDDLATLTTEAHGGTNLDAAEIAKIQERIEEVLGHAFDAAQVCASNPAASAAWGRFDALLDRT